MSETNAAFSSELQKYMAENVFRQSQSVSADSVPVQGYDFNQGVDYHELLKSFKTVGFQATHFGQAVEEINKMISKKLQPSPMVSLEEMNYFFNGRKITNCTIFLGFTSNMISSGVRETIRYIVQNNMVDCLVTTAGAIEEDIMKSMAPTFLGDFGISGAELRTKGINRIGNLLIPNNNYCKLEEWMYPILDKILDEQNSQKINWTPSKLIARLGQEVNHPESVLFWAYKNKIPVFSPAITDGAVGDNLFFHSFKNPGLRLDIVEDITKINKMAMQSHNTGMIILGGGLVKHHICNANLMRNGADFSVFVNTAQEFDGSDSGARPDEAVSWGKIKMDATPVKVYGEATLIFPLLVAETFARNFKIVPDKS